MERDRSGRNRKRSGTALPAVPFQTEGFPFRTRLPVPDHVAELNCDQRAGRTFHFHGKTAGSPINPPEICNLKASARRKRDAAGPEIGLRSVFQIIAVRNSVSVPVDGQRGHDLLQWKRRMIVQLYRPLFMCLDRDVVLFHPCKQFVVALEKRLPSARKAPDLQMGEKHGRNMTGNCVGNAFFHLCECAPVVRRRGVRTHAETLNRRVRLIVAAGLRRCARHTAPAEIAELPAVNPGDPLRLHKTLPAAGLCPGARERKTCGPEIFPCPLRQKTEKGVRGLNGGIERKKNHVGRTVCVRDVDGLPPEAVHHFLSVPDQDAVDFAGGGDQDLAREAEVSAQGFRIADQLPVPDLSAERFPARMVRV